jgi:2-dehydropantoate 2-reductase
VAGSAKRNLITVDILIVGTGALATLFAARLTSSGHCVTMLGTWPEGLSALRQNGARIIDENGDEQNFSVHAIDDPKECRGAKVAIVLVKSWQTERAAHQLKECLSNSGLAITLQNGLGNREVLKKYLDEPFTTEDTESTEKKNEKDSVNSAVSHRHTVGVRGTNGVVKNPSRVALGTITIGATLLGPGLVKAGGDGTISIEAHPALGPIEEALKSAKFKVEVVDDVLSIVWSKLIINAAINPLTALLKIPNGELLERPSARELMSALAKEAASVASAEKVNLPFRDPVAFVEDVARKTAGNHSSMLQDIQRGAPTEINAICGAVVRAARRHHIPTPINYACWQLVLALSSGR